MALEFIDSFGHSGQDDGTPPPLDVYNKWTNANGTNGGYYTNPSASTPGPVRGSGHCIALVGSIWKTLPLYVNYRVMGTAYYYSSSSVKGFPMVFASGGTTLVQLVIENDNTLSVYGNNNLIYNTGSNSPAFIFTSDVYHYLEMEVLITGGTPISARINVYCDGVLVINDQIGTTNVNKNQLLCDDVSMNQVALGGAQGGGDTSWACDTYVLNANTTDIFGADTTNVQPLGDVGIYAVFPNVDSTVQWQPVPNTGNSFSNVNLDPPIDDSSYVYTDTVGQIETFKFTPITGFTGTILGAQLLVYAKKDAEGIRAFKPAIDGGSFTDVDNYLYDYYDYFIWPMDTNNGTAWTPTNFNSQNFGAVLTI